MKTFYAYAPRGTFVGLGVGFLILFVSIGLPWFLPSDGLEQGSWSLLIPSLIGLFFLYVLFASLFKMFVSYTVTNTGVTIYKPPFHKKVIDKDAILSAEYLDATSTSQLMEASMVEQESYGQNTDLVGYIQMLKKESPVYRYFTLTPSNKPGKQKENAGVLSEGMVVITLKSNDDLYLTPKNPVAFYDALSVMLGKV